MKQFVVKKEKWYHSSYAIFQNNELIGEYLPANFKKGNQVSLFGKNFHLKNINIWKNQKQIFIGNIKIAELYEKPLKGETLLHMVAQGSFILKKNIWKNRCTLNNGDKEIGEFKTKTFNTIVTVGDQVDDALLASAMLIAMQQDKHYIALIMLIPTFISLFT